MFGPHPRPVVEATARGRAGRVDAVPDVRLHLHRTAGAVDLLVSSAGEAGARRVHHVVRRRLVHGGDRNGRDRAWSALILDQAAGAAIWKAECTFGGCLGA